MANPTFHNPNVKAIFDFYPEEIQQHLLRLRALIYDVAFEMDEVGTLEETLKWNQPSYLTSETRSGTTVRIDAVKNTPNHYAMYVNCQTTLIETFRQMYPDLTYEGNRAVIFDTQESLPTDMVKNCVAMALTYHLHKR